MCNLYNLKMNKTQLQQAVGSYIDLTDSASFYEKIYLGYPAPVLRNNLDFVELGLSRWGMPTLSIYMKGEADKGITCVGEYFIPAPVTVAWRCKPAPCTRTSFSEYAQEPDPKIVKTVALICGR